MANLHKAEESKIIYTTGFMIEFCYDTILELIKFKGDRLFAFNIGGIYVCEKFKDQLQEIIPHVDLLFGNHEEFESLKIEL